MSQQQRFTAWLSNDERAGIERLARESGTTMNFVVRIAIRKYLGMPSTPLFQASADVTSVTRNK